MRDQFRTVLFTAILVTASLVAYADDANSTKIGSAPTAHAAESSTRPPPLHVSEAQIFGVLNAANTGEIDAGNMAQQKSSNDHVKKFAAMMVMDHTKLNDQGSVLATKLGITPDNSSRDCQKITDENGKTKTKLEGLDGADFDKAYVASQVQGHKEVLHLIDRTLLPSAKTPEIQAMLKQARPIVAMHLKHAQHLQAELKKAPKTTENP